jgi:catechol 2,3-dioxygenase-like lactoylglutathione lyase family enzyme
MIDHTGMSVSDYERSKNFYAMALAPLGFSVIMEFPGADGTMACGFGVGGKPSFWVSGEGKTSPALHIAFLANDRESVDAFYEAALAAGGKDNGAPGIRAHYHANYYGAFVLDPDGHNVEGVCHKPGAVTDQKTF